MPQKLSEILTVGSEFNFFKAVAHLEPFDLPRLETVVDDMLRYTARVLQILAHLGSLDGSMDVHWLTDGKDKFYDIYRNIDSIDSVVLQALNLLESNLLEHEMATTEVFDKLDYLSQRSLDIKGGYLLPLKSKIDVSIEYNDIYNLMMNSINNELEHCLKKCFKILEKRFSSPVRHAPTFNLEMLTKKLLQQRNQLRLPLLNEIDNELYEEYIELKTMVDPLKASLNFIPIRIDDFIAKYGETNFADTKKISDKYESLIKEMQFLQNEVNDLKYELVDKRWSEIFSYLNTEMSFLITNVEKEILKIQTLDNDSNIKSQVLKRLKYTTDIVENTFILINQAIDEGLIDIRTMEKSNELAAQWLELKSKVPQAYIDEIERDNGMDDDHNTMTQNFKKLSLEENFRNVSNEDKPQRVTSGQDRTKKEKRKSVYGQFLFNKMNIQTVMIEGDPTSAKKPEELHPKILTNSVKLNQIDDASLGPKEILDYKRIPELKNSLSADIPQLGPEELLSSPESSIASPMGSPVRSHSSFAYTSGSPVRRGPFVQLSPIIDNTPVRDSHEKTLSQLMGGTPSDYDTPVPIRHHRNANVMTAGPDTVLTQSKIPIPSGINIRSRIPRPVSRVSLGRHVPLTQSDDRLGGKIDYGRSSSSLGFRQSNRSSMQMPAPAQRHSVIPQTPVRLRQSSRRSLLPQPTPIREIMEQRSNSRMGQRSESRLSSGSSSRRSSRAPSALDGRQEPVRSIWRP